METVAAEFGEWVIMRVRETAERVAGDQPPTDTDYVLAARIVVGPHHQNVLRTLRETFRAKGV